MLRLIAYLEGEARHFPILRSEMLVGRHPECDVCLPLPGVAEQHARLWLRETDLEIEDLGARRGVLVNGERVQRSVLTPLDEVRIGSVSLLLEEVSPAVPRRLALPEPTLESTIDAGRMLVHLAAVSRWVLSDAASRRTLESLVTAILRDFGGGALFLLEGEGESQGVRFVVATDPAWLGAGEALSDALSRSGGDGATPGEMLVRPLAASEGRPSCHLLAQAIQGLGRPYRLLLAVPHLDGTAWGVAAALQTLGELLVLGLVHHVGRYEPIVPGHAARPDLVLDPELVVGESKSMQDMLEQLKAAVEPPVNVLLLGPPGSGRRRVARTLHLSGVRREQPFVIADCSGAEPRQVEADLFGAELPGKREPLRRVGKLELANGGTVLLSEVDALPLTLQGRLMRFVRAGEVEAAGSLDARRVDVRLIASSREPLEDAVARGTFRLDLAYQLARAAVQVPSLSERREDLPLLIQAAVNRACHESGKRVRGISLRAMGLLTGYDYPGNLPELESLVRQLVHRCSDGQPIDVAHLPRAVRTAPVRREATVDGTSDLRLDALIAACERAAIREALKRSGGNRSQSARLLGLSRNGLATKIKRHGIE